MVGELGTHSLGHTYRTLLDSTGTPVGVQQRLMRHADIRTTMNVYGGAATEHMKTANRKVVQMVLPAYRHQVVAEWLESGWKRTLNH